MPNTNEVDQIIDLAAIDAQFKKVFLLMDELNKRIVNLNNTTIKLPRVSGGTSSTGGNGAGGSKAQDDAAKLEAAYKRLSLAESELGRKISEVNEKTRQQNVLNAQNARQNLAQAGSLNDLRARLAAATTAFDNMSAAERRMATGGKAAIEQIKQLQQEVRELEQETGRFQRNVGNYPQQVVSVGTNILGAFGITTGVAAIGATAKAVFDTTKQLESYKVALKAVSGTEEEFIKNQQYLASLTDRLGLNILEIGNSFKLFYAASTQAGLGADKTREIFTAASEASATLKLSQEDTNGVLLAFSQILGKGKVQAEELRGQIGERVPGAFAIAARSIGVTQEQLNKMLEKGEVVASDFLPKFASELKRTFGRESQEPVDSLQGAINRLSNSFTDLVQNNESGLNRLFKGIVNGANDALSGLDLYLSNAQKFYSGKLFSGERLAREFQKSYAGGVAEIRKLKQANDAVFDDFTKRDTDQQQKEADKYKRIAELSAAAYSDAIQRFGKNSEQARALGKQLIQDQDLAQRLAKYITPAKTATDNEAEIKKESRLKEIALKEERDGLIARLQEEADYQKRISETEQYALSRRIEALNSYTETKNKIIDVSSQYDKRIAEENIKQGQATAKSITNIQEKELRDRNANLVENLKLAADITQDDQTRQFAKLMEESQKRRDFLANQAIDTENQLKNLRQKGQISEEQYQVLLRQTQNKYQQLQLQDEIDTVQKIIEIRKVSGQNVEEQEAKLRGIRLKLRELELEDFNKIEDAKTEKTDEELKKRKELHKRFQERLVQLGKEAFDVAIDLFNTQFEAEKEMIDKLIEENETRTQSEIATVNRSTASEQEKADRLLVINQRSQAEAERLAARKKQIELAQARFDRAKNVAAIIQSTATAIMQTFAQFPFYLAAPLAAIIGGIGAAQLATVLSSPLPRYKDGRDGGKAEWAIVGDGGRPEVIEHNGRAWVTPDHDTLTYLPAGAKVHKSHEDFMHDAHGIALKQLLPVHQYQHRQPERDNSDIIRAIKQSKTTVNITNTWHGITHQAMSAAGQIEYLNKNVYQ